MTDEAVTSPKATFRQARIAFQAIRLIDGFDANTEGAIKPLQAFKDNMRARYCALRLQRRLKEVIEASEGQLVELNERYLPKMTEAGKEGAMKYSDPADKVAHDQEERKLLAQEIDGLNVEEVALKLSVIGDSLKNISSDLLMDLGPFLIVDVEEESLNGKPRKP